MLELASRKDIFDKWKKANKMRVKVDRRHLGRNLARVLNRHTIAELITIWEDKEGKSQSYLQNTSYTEMGKRIYVGIGH